MTVGQNDSVAVTREYNPSYTEPSIAVISALAEIKNTKPTDFDTPLQRVFDVDSFNRLISEDQEVSVKFVYDGYQITIDESTLVIEISD